MQLWVSVGGFSAADFASVCERLDERPEVATIELNLSCPNVEEAPETSAQIVAAARAVTSKTALRQALACELGHRRRRTRRRRRRRRRTLTREHDPWPGTRPPHAAPSAGPRDGRLLGPALKPIALACVFACAQAVDLPIVGMGGVAAGIDALELVAVGASAVALGTILFSDPAAPTRIRAELEAEAAARGFDQPEDARGIGIKMHDLQGFFPA